MTILPFVSLCVAALALPSISSGANNATDNAGNYLGKSTYIGYTGGTGFLGAFQYAGGTQFGAFLGTSGQINTAGQAFGLSGTASSACEVNRTFSPGDANTLNVGQVFEIQLQPQSGSFSLGFDRYSDIGTAVFLSGSSANTDYILSVTDYPSSPLQPVTRTIDTGVPYTTNSVAMTYTQGVASFTLGLTPFGGTTVTTTQPLTFSPPYDCNLYVGLNSTLYFNNLMVVPEPNALAILWLGALGGAGLALMRHRCRAC